MVVSGVVDFNTYERALRDFVAVGADGHITRIGWNTKSAAPVTTASENVAVGTGDYRYGAPAPDRKLDLWVENITPRSEEHTSELQSQSNLVCRLLLEKKKSITD